MSIGNPTLRVLNDSDWGLLILNPGEEAVSPILDVYAGTHYVEITIDKYETGTGSRETYIRYSSVIFAYDDPTPTWELYIGGRNVTGRYIQIKLKGL